MFPLTARREIKTKSLLSTVSVDETACFPVSFQQETILLAAEWHELHSLPYCQPILPIGIHFTGLLDIALLQRTINEVIARHSALRAAFFPRPSVSPEERLERLEYFGRTGTFTPGLYMQTVSNIQDLYLRELRVASPRFRSPVKQAEALFRRELETPFDLSTPPLIRALLIQLNSNTYLLVLTVHHIAADAWSLGLIRNELECLYKQACGIATSRCLDEPVCDYVQFVQAQNTSANTEAFDSAIRYWRQEWLQFASARLALDDLTMLRPAKRSHINDILASGRPPIFCSEDLVLSLSTLEALVALTASARITIYMFLLSCLGLLIYQYTDKALVALWAHFANRTSTTFHNTVGCFYTSHLLGIDLRADPTIRQLFLQVRKTVLTGALHQHLPLSFMWYKLECFPLQQDLRVLLDYKYENEPAKDDDNTDCHIQIRDAALPTSRRERFAHLGCYVTHSRSSLLLSFRYSTRLFSRSAIMEMLTKYNSIISDCIAQPDVPSSVLLQRRGITNHMSKTVMREMVVTNTEVLRTIGPQSSL